MKFEAQIDKSFRKNERDTVFTVSDMIDELKNLPAGLPIGDQYGDRCKVSVINVFGSGLRAIVRPSVTK
tara:strand:- start:35145 stop:35351 length:207 start_codon:yes stop_codon:yes gene_type:complete